MMEHPPLVRNVALVGAMHAGKTAIMDCLVHTTHPDVKRKKNGEFCKSRRALALIVTF